MKFSTERSEANKTYIHSKMYLGWSYKSMIYLIENGITLSPFSFFALGSHTSSKGGIGRRAGLHGNLRTYAELIGPHFLIVDH